MENATFSSQHWNKENTPRQKGWGVVYHLGRIKWLKIWTMAKGLREWMRKHRRPKLKDDATSVGDYSRTSVVSKFTKESPSAKSSVSNAERLSLQSDLSECVKVVLQSVEEDQGQEANHSAPDLPAQPTQSTGRGGESESPKDFKRKPHLN